MINFKVNQEKCTQCKMCVSDCPVFIIKGKTDFPEIKEGKDVNCIKCQHCIAICPEGAISIWGKKPENSILVSNQIPKSIEIENLLQTRRSIRKFKMEELDKNKIHHLISMASYAPTAQNQNAVLFTVVDNRNDMSKLRELAYSHIKNAYDENRLPKSFLYLNNFQNVWEEKQIDVIFRNAPHLLIVSAPKSNVSPIVDSNIAMTYFDLLASANGIGTLWDGFAQYLFEDVAPELKIKVGIPENHKVAAVMLFGKPAVKYTRSIQNDNTKINCVNLDSDVDVI